MNKSFVVLVMLLLIASVTALFDRSYFIVEDLNVTRESDVNGTDLNVNWINSVIAYCLDGNCIYSWNDINGSGTGSSLDTNWSTSWGVFDANLSQYYVKQVDGNLWYAFKNDVNSLINQNTFGSSDFNSVYLGGSGDINGTDINVNNFWGRQYNWNDTNKAITIGTETSKTLTGTTSLGYNAGYLNQGIYQSAIGQEAGKENTGNYQFALGYLSGYQNNQLYQIAIGVNAGYRNKGTNQTVIGYSAGQDNNNGYQIAIGQTAGQNNHGLYQNAIGYGAGKGNEKDGQTTVGHQSGENNTGVNQTALGYTAGRYNTANYQVAIGTSAGYQNTGTAQTSIGYQAGQKNSGLNQVAIGYEAGEDNNVSGQTAIGYQAGKSNIGESSTQVGYLSGYQNKGITLTSLGTSSGYTNTGDYCIAMGYQSLYGNTATGSTGIGYQAGYSNDGTYLSASGYISGRDNQGTYLSALGSQAGRLNQGDRSNVIGYKAGYNNQSDYLTAIGFQAGNETTGLYNIYLGTNAGSQNNSKNYVIAIGQKAGYLNNGNAGIYIGDEAGNGNTEDNLFILKQNIINVNPLIQGNFGTADLNLIADVRTYDIIPLDSNTSDLGSSAYPFRDIYLQNTPTVLSDEGFKTGVTDSDLGLHFLKRLRPVYFNWIDDDKVHYGFIAQELFNATLSTPNANNITFVQPQRTITEEKEICGEEKYDCTEEITIIEECETNEAGEEMCVSYEDIGEEICKIRKVCNIISNSYEAPATIQPMELIPILVKAVQELDSENQHLQSQINSLDARLKALETGAGK